MFEAKSTLTVYFEEPFWVGVYEREIAGKTEAAKIIFAKEPKDYEVYAYLNTNFPKMKFSPPVLGHGKEHTINPKRMQRQIRAQLGQRGIATKAQLALKLQQEEQALAKKTRQREQKATAKNQQFELHRKKQKEKHKGH